MAKIKDIIEKIETLAPLETQEPWDNSGWQIDLGIKETNSVLLALNVTEETVKQAVKHGCGLIISHHPMIFQPLKNIRNKAIISAIQNNISVYSTHTSFDKAEIGTTQTLGEALKKQLNLSEFKEINDFTKSAKLNTPLELEAFVKKVKSALKLKSIKISKPKKVIKSIAFCAGAGADFVNEVKKYNVDCFVTADVKYHQALDSSVMIVDIGHFESEVIALTSLKKALNMPDLNIILSKEEPVFEIV